MNRQRAPKRGRFRGWLRLLIRVALLAAVCCLLLTQVFLLTRVHEQGMFPALKDGDLAIGFRLNKDALSKKDVIVYRVDGAQRVGRIVARGNDVVEITENGTLIVNGTPQLEEIVYPTEGGTLLEYPYRVPQGSVFVLGDFRTNTVDSRNLGAIPMESIEARIITILRRRGL